MPEHYKQTVRRFPLQVFVVLLVAALLLVFYSVSFAPTSLPEEKPLKMTAKTLTDRELGDIYAQAFFQLQEFTSSHGSSNVIRMTLGMDMIMNAHIESFKTGYYGGGWDQDTINYYWGGNDYSAGIPANSLIWHNIFVEMGFENLGATTGKCLNYIEFGTPSAEGPTAGDFPIMSGITAGGTGTNNGILYRGTAAGRRIVTFSNTNLSFVFASKYTVGGSNLRGIFLNIPGYNTNTVTRPY